MGALPMGLLLGALALKRPSQPLGLSVIVVLPTRESTRILSAYVCHARGSVPRGKSKHLSIGPPFPMPITT